MKSIKEIWAAHKETFYCFVGGIFVSAFLWVLAFIAMGKGVFW